MTSEERKHHRYLRRVAKREQKKLNLSKYNDFDWVFSYEHLYKSYKKSKKGVRWKASTQKYIDLLKALL